MLHIKKLMLSSIAMIALIMSLLQAFLSFTHPDDSGYIFFALISFLIYKIFSHLRKELNVSNKS